MTEIINNISEIAQKYDAIVFDQWGVLHDGKLAYEGVIACLEGLKKNNTRLAVLSNSGKRSELNEKRILEMGFSNLLFEFIMTSGEALWRDIAYKIIKEKSFFPIERNVGDAKVWANGLEISLEYSIDSAQAILLMGLPDDDDLKDWQAILARGLALNIPLYCSNPDLLSIRPGKKLITAPGLLAEYYSEGGGEVVYYGKPHKHIFKNLQTILNANRLLMIGDSLGHDILGGNAMGWDTLLLLSGVHASDFVNGDHGAILEKIIHQKRYSRPMYMMERLK